MYPSGKPRSGTAKRTIECGPVPRARRFLGSGTGHSVGGWGNTSHPLRSRILGLTLRVFPRQTRHQAEVQGARTRTASKNRGFRRGREPADCNLRAHCGPAPTGMFRAGQGHPGAALGELTGLSSFTPRA
jgi:hypothetical protein